MAKKEGPKGANLDGVTLFGPGAPENDNKTLAFKSVGDLFPRPLDDGDTIPEALMGVRGTTNEGALAAADTLPADEDPHPGGGPSDGQASGSASVRLMNDAENNTSVERPGAKARVSLQNGNMPSASRPLFRKAAGNTPSSIPDSHNAICGREQGRELAAIVKALTENGETGSHLDSNRSGNDPLKDQSNTTQDIPAYGLTLGGKVGQFCSKWWNKLLGRSKSI